MWCVQVLGVVHTGMSVCLSVCWQKDRKWSFCQQTDRQTDRQTDSHRHEGICITPVVHVSVSGGKNITLKWIWESDRIVYLVCIVDSMISLPLSYGFNRPN